MRPGKQHAHDWYMVLPKGLTAERRMRCHGCAFSASLDEFKVLLLGLERRYPKAAE